MGPAVRGKKGNHQNLFEEIQRKGFVKVRVNGDVMKIQQALDLDLERYEKHTVEVLVDKLVIPEELEKEDKERIRDSVEEALKIGDGLLIAEVKKNDQIKDKLFSEKFACPQCGKSIAEIEPRTFSFNSPYGACPECNGLGEKKIYDKDLIIPDKSLSIGEGAIKPWATASHRVGRQGHYWSILSELADKTGFDFSTPWQKLSEKSKDIILNGSSEYDFEGVIPNLKRRYQETSSKNTREEIEEYTREKTCPACNGARLKEEALHVKIGSKNIDQVTSMDLEKLEKFLRAVKKNEAQKFFSDQDVKVAAPILKELVERVKFLNKVGVSYLTLSRTAKTLSNGESQRIRLATQIGSGLTGVLYILDEPTIGLHQKDQSRLIDTLKHLRDLGNTVVIVEHDAQSILEADWIIDMGPGAGQNGGKIVAEGTPEEIAKKDTPTGRYLKKAMEENEAEYGKFESESSEKISQAKHILLEGASEHNLKDIDVKIPLEKFVSITGVSGSGKSSLVNDTLSKILFQEFYSSKEKPGEYKSIQGLGLIDKVISIDQSAIGRTPRSNPATYTKVFTPIREIFAQTKEAEVRGYDKGRFSFNVKGGRCEACKGQGSEKVEMQFLADIYVECEKCHGKRYNDPTLEIRYKGKNIADILEMTVDQAADFFSEIPKISRRLETLQDVGLGYIELGQPATTLSGGEAQRVKLAKELSKVQTTNTFYILDEPTSGLHHEDIQKLLEVLRQLVERGNTVLVVEHNMDVIAESDWIIDLGPEGGKDGGKIVAQGSPSKIIQTPESYTGKFLKHYSV